MNLKLTLAIVAASIAVITAPTVMAQGKGGGLNRAIGAPSGTGGARAIGGKSSDAMARASGNLARGGMGLNKSAPGLSRVGSNPTPSRDSGSTLVGGDQSLANQQRIFDQRTQQAEHLRGVSQRNGNERLLDTADRMDSSAVRNFERQTGTVVQSPAGDGTTAPAPAIESANQPRKSVGGLWFRSR